MPRLLIALLLVALAPVFLFGFLYLNTFSNDWTGVPTDFSGSSFIVDKPAAWKEPVTLKLVTFNIQDLLVVAKDHEDRMMAIARKLATIDPDIVGFQEAFIGEHRELLTQELEKYTRLRHFQYYPSGKVGSGVFTASVFPIREVWFHRYEASNPWWKVWEGDYWAGKGVGLARIQLPNGAMLDFFNTHAQADYGVPANTIVRRNQMAGLARFVNEAKAGTVPVIVVGDLNSRVGSEEFNAAVLASNLARVMNIDSHIDHILAVNDQHYRFEVTDTQPIAERVRSNGKEFDLSDHHGFVSQVTITPVSPAFTAPEAK